MVFASLVCHTLSLQCETCGVLYQHSTNPTSLLPGTFSTTISNVQMKSAKMQIVPVCVGLCVWAEFEHFGDFDTGSVVLHANNRLVYHSFWLHFTWALKSPNLNNQNRPENRYRKPHFKFQRIYASIRYWCISAAI